MAINSFEIIQDIRTDFEEMLDFVTGEEARTATADQIERGLFSLLLALGQKLLGLFFAIRTQISNRDKHQREDGCELPYQQDKKRDYFAIFGKLSIFRPYFYKKGVGSALSLDAELSLGKDCYSDLVREIRIPWGLYGLRQSQRYLEAHIEFQSFDASTSRQHSRGCQRSRSILPTETAAFTGR